MRTRDLDPPARVYDAVLRLRRKGHRVEAAGTRDRHVLDGEIVPTSWLLDMARGVAHAPEALRSSR